MNDLFVLAYCKRIHCIRAGRNGGSNPARDISSFLFDFCVSESFNEVRSLLSDFLFLKRVVSSKELAEPFENIIDVVDDLLCLKNIYRICSPFSCRPSSTYVQDPLQLRENILGKFKNGEVRKKLFHPSNSSVRDIFFSDVRWDPVGEVLSPETYKLNTPVSYLEFEEKLKSTAKELGQIPSSFVSKITPIIELLIMNEKFPLFYLKNDTPSEHLDVLLTIVESALIDIVNFCGAMFFVFLQHLFLGTSGMFNRVLFFLQLARSREGFTMDFDPERIRNRLTGFVQTEFLQYIRPTKSFRRFLGRNQNCVHHSFPESVSDLIQGVCHQIDQLCDELKNEEKNLNQEFEDFASNPTLNVYDIKYKFGSLTKTVAEGSVFILLDKVQQWFERQYSKKLPQQRENQKINELECCSHQRWKRLLNREENMVSLLNQLLKRNSTEASIIATGGSCTADEPALFLNSKGSENSNLLEDFTSPEKQGNMLSPNISLPLPKPERISSGAKKKTTSIPILSEEEREKKSVLSNTLPSDPIRTSHSLQRYDEKRRELTRDFGTKRKGENVSLPYINTGEGFSNPPFPAQDSQKSQLPTSHSSESPLTNKNAVVFRPVPLSLTSTDGTKGDSSIPLDSPLEGGKHILPSAKKGIGQVRQTLSSSSSTYCGVPRPVALVREERKAAAKPLPSSGKKDVQVEEGSQESFTTNTVGIQDDCYNLTSSPSHQTSEAAETSFSASVNQEYQSVSAPPGPEKGETFRDGAPGRIPLLRSDTRTAASYHAPRSYEQTARLSKMPATAMSSEEKRKGKACRVAGKSTPWWKKSQTESIQQQHERKKQLYRLQKLMEEVSSPASEQSSDAGSGCFYSRSPQAPFNGILSVEEQEEKKLSRKDRVDSSVSSSVVYCSPCVSSTPQHGQHSTNLPQIFPSKVSYDQPKPFRPSDAENREPYGLPPQPCGTANKNVTGYYTDSHNFTSLEGGTHFSYSHPLPLAVPPASTQFSYPVTIRSTYPTVSPSSFSDNARKYPTEGEFSLKGLHTSSFQRELSGNISPQGTQWSSEENKITDEPEGNVYEEESFGGVDMVGLYQHECQKNGVKPTVAFLRVLETVRYNLWLSEIDFSSLSCDIRDIRPVLSLLAYNQDYLQVLNFSNCYLENKHIVELFYFLRRGNTGANLEELNLSYNPITYVGGKSILKIVTHCPSLRSVDLSGTSIPQAVMQEINDLIEERL